MMGRFLNVCSPPSILNILYTPCRLIQNSLLVLAPLPVADATTHYLVLR